MCSFGDVKEYDVGNGDDILAYPSQNLCGSPNNKITLTGDESGSYVTISYTVTQALY